MGERTPPRTRVVGYQFDGDFDENACEKVLEAALRRHVVTEYDCGSSTDKGIFIWFNGPPGASLRAVRDAIERLERKAPSR